MKKSDLAKTEVKSVEVEQLVHTIYEPLEAGMPETTVPDAPIIEENNPLPTPEFTPYIESVEIKEEGFNIHLTTVFDSDFETLETLLKKHNIPFEYEEFHKGRMRKYYIEEASREIVEDKMGGFNMIERVK